MFLYEFIIVLAILLILIIQGIKINDFYEIHLSLIISIKDIIVNLKKFSEFYFDKNNGYVPSTDLHLKGV